ncbi:MAG: hypothetical protein KIT22_08420 [Verrucomicrobiae bacterium]|nr:hypothetical protein [Verrucomicrobiae bacterium]
MEPWRSKARRSGIYAALAILVSGVPFLMGGEEGSASVRGGNEGDPTGDRVQVRVADREEIARLAESRAAAPSFGEPVTSAAWTEPADVHRGTAFDLVVALRIAAGHHIYSPDKGGQGTFAPTTVRLVLPDGLAAEGDWVVSVPDRVKDGRIEAAAVIFRRTIQAGLNAPAGRVSMQVELRYQACTEELCWPPRKVTLEARARMTTDQKEAP